MTTERETGAGEDALRALVEALADTEFVVGQDEAFEGTEHASAPAVVKADRERAKAAREAVLAWGREAIARAERADWKLANVKPAYDAMLATAKRSRDEALAQRDNAVAHAVKLEESPLRFENFKLTAERDAARGQRDAAERERDEARAEIAKAEAVIAGTAYPSDATLTREQAFHGWEVANRQRDKYAESARAAEARGDRLAGALRRAIEAIDRAEPMKHSPWCNGVHEGGACEGDYLMVSFVAELRAALAEPGGDTRNSNEEG